MSRSMPRKWTPPLDGRSIHPATRMRTRMPNNQYAVLRRKSEISLLVVLPPKDGWGCNKTA
jgi:hypothetical protein